MFITKCAWCKSNRPLPDNIYCSPKCEHDDPSSEELIKKHQQEKAKATEEHLQDPSKKHFKYLTKAFMTSLTLTIILFFFTDPKGEHKLTMEIAFAACLISLVLISFITISAKIFYLNKTPSNTLKKLFQITIITLCISFTLLIPITLKPHLITLTHLFRITFITFFVSFLSLTVRTITNVRKEKKSNTKT